MAGVNPSNLEEQLELTLDALPTAFSKLAFLTSLRDPYTGKYLHEGWLLCASRDEVHKILQDTHQRVFEVVLSLTVPLLCGELKSYLESLSESRERTVHLWLELESYREMIPEGVCAEARELFVSQMRLALSVLVSAPDWPQIRVLSASKWLPLVPQSRRRVEN